MPHHTFLFPRHIANEGKRQRACELTCPVCHRAQKPEVACVLATQEEKRKKSSVAASENLPSPATAAIQEFKDQQQRREVALTELKHQDSCT